MKLVYNIWLLLPFFLFSCSESSDWEDNASAEGITIPVTLKIGTSDELGTKAAPPGSGEANEGELRPVSGTSVVDEVWLLPFRRQTGTNGSFLYDATNDKKLVCADESGIRVARGSLSKIQGYEYRVIALGYSKQRGEDTKFSLGTLSASTTFESLKVTITSKDTTVQNGSTTSVQEAVKKIESPELFYGYCDIGDGNPIIQYASGSGLTGTLYRSMGMLEVTIRNIKSESEGLWRAYYFAALYAKTANSASGMSDYDNFKVTSTPIVSAPGWTLLQYINMTNTAGDPISPTVDGTNITFRVFCLATVTKLKIRFKSASNSVETVTCDDYNVHVSNTSGASNATGIISPVAQNDSIYVRRNKQYILSGNYATLTND